VNFCAPLTLRLFLIGQSLPNKLSIIYRHHYFSFICIFSMRQHIRDPRPQGLSRNSILFNSTTFGALLTFFLGMISYLLLPILLQNQPRTQHFLNATFFLRTLQSSELPSTSASTTSPFSYSYVLILCLMQMQTRVQNPRNPRG